MDAVQINEVDGVERAYELDQDLIDAVLHAVENDDRTSLITLFEDVHAADIADILEQISSNKRKAVMALWGDQLDGDVLAEMDEALSADILESLPDNVVSEVVKDLETDDVVDLVEELDQGQIERVLDALEDADAVAVRRSLTYPEDTAGRLMQTEMVMAPTHWTVGDAINRLRSESDLPEQYYDLVVVDPKSRPIGKVPLSNLLSNPRKTQLIDVMDEEFRTIPVQQSQEDVAYAFNQYNMVSAPVVDEEGRLVGIITIDDAMEVLGEEAEEDIKLLAGVGDESLSNSIIDITRRRFPWLAVNLVTAILASLVISKFSATIESIVALAILMPIVASMGGNAGTQTLTVAVRAIATKDITASNAVRVIRREILVGLLNGAVFAVIVGAVGYFWFGEWMLGVVLALAMIANMLMAGLAGIVIPLILNRMNIDPALGSSALVTTVTDVVGFFAFLSLAAWLLF